MSLENLIGISLEAFEPDSSTITRLLAAAERNIADYSGDLVPINTVHECMWQSESLMETVKQWLKTNRPALSIENGSN